MDKISILVCAYNTQSTLWKCIRSAVLQSYRPIEVILIDDGSTDKTGKVADFLSERYQEVKVIHQKHQGIAAARNRALQQTSGDWIFFLDSDDTLEENALYLMMRYRKYSDADCIIGSYYNHFSFIRWKCGINKSQCISKRTFFKELLKDKKIKSYLWGKLFHRSLIENLTFCEGKVFEDIDVIAKIGNKAKKIEVIKEPVYHYTMQRKGSITAWLPYSIMQNYLVASEHQIAYIYHCFPDLQKQCKKAYRKRCLIVVLSGLMHLKLDFSLLKKILLQDRQLLNL